MANMEPWMFVVGIIVVFLGIGAFFSLQARRRRADRFTDFKETQRALREAGHENRPFSGGAGWG